MMKIAILIQKLNFGGAERCASNMSIDLEKQFETHLIVFDGANQMYPHGGVLHDLHSSPTSNKFKKIINIFYRIRRVKDIKKKEKFDCAISLLTGANYVNVKSQTGEKTIISIRNNLSLSRLSFREVKMVQESCNAADCVVALSESVRRDMIANFNVNENKIITIYNSVDARRLHKLAMESSFQTGLTIDGDYVVTMGRLMHQKGQWHLIRAFSEVHKQYPNIKLVILGEGEDEFAEKIKELAKRLHIEDYVVFAGYIKNPHFIIRKSKIFVFTSLYEGLGNVLLEALACGKAIISTDCIAGPREILAPSTDICITEEGKLQSIEYAEYGVLIPPFDQEDDLETTQITEKELILAEAICTLYRSPEIINKYEEQSQKRIMDFAPEKIAADWEHAIRNICGIK